MRRGFAGFCHSTWLPAVTLGERPSLETGRDVTSTNTKVSGQLPAEWRSLSNVTAGKKNVPTGVDGAHVLILDSPDDRCVGYIGPCNA